MRLDPIGSLHSFLYLTPLYIVYVEMVIKTYGRWIPDSSTQSDYRPIHDWSRHLG